jgi:two-component system, NarL family, response regulator NreC
VQNSPDGSARVRVVIADDHQILRDGIRLLLETSGAYEVVGEAADGREAVRIVEELRPEVVIMDFSMPELNGLDATRLVLEKHPEALVVCLSMHRGEREVVDIFSAGARGYVLKTGAFDELLQALQAVLSGNHYVSPGVAQVVVQRALDVAARPQHKGRAALTGREREVVQLIAEGMTTKEIASRLLISVKTIESHRKVIMDKLGIRSIAGLTKWALREGLTPGE